jgi:hypothetical protein
MRPPWRHVLRREHPAERFGEVVAYILELLALDSKGGALPQVDDPRENGPGRRRGGVDGKPLLELGLEARRQVSEEGQVGGNPVAFGRIMSPAQLLEPAIVAVAE